MVQDGGKKKKNKNKNKKKQQQQQNESPQSEIEQQEPAQTVAPPPTEPEIQNGGKISSKFSLSRN